MQVFIQRVLFSPDIGPLSTVKITNTEFHEDLPSDSEAAPRELTGTYDDAKSRLCNCFAYVLLRDKDVSVIKH
jgi:hypothetical protein